MPIKKNTERTLSQTIMDCLNGLWGECVLVANGIFKHDRGNAVCFKTNVDGEEAKISKALCDGPSIIPFIGYNRMTQILCMKSCSGDLHDLLTRRIDKHDTLSDTLTTEKERRGIMTQLLKAVRYMHSKGIVHRDIKLENILYELDDDGRIRIFLSDFGVSVDKNNNNPMIEFKGTLSYLSPESLRRRSNVTYKDDAWSCAIVAYVLLVGQFPFEQHNVTEYIKADDLHTEVWKNEAYYAKYILSTLVKECKRISVGDALTHCFGVVDVNQVADERAFKKRRKDVDTPPR